MLGMHEPLSSYVTRQLSWDRSQNSLLQFTEKKKSHEQDILPKKIFKSINRSLFVSYGTYAMILRLWGMPWTQDAEVTKLLDISRIKI